MTMGGPVAVDSRRDDTRAAPGGAPGWAVVLLLLAAATTALTAVPHLMLVSRFLRLPPSPGRPDVLFVLEVVQVPACLVIGAVLVIAARSAWRTWGPALLAGVAGSGLFLGALPWFRVWSDHTPAERRTIIVLVVSTVAALAVALGAALAARPAAVDRWLQPAWSRPFVLIPVQALAVAAVLPDALDDYRYLADPPPGLGVDTTVWPAFGIVAAALLVAASTWALDRPHTALYTAALVSVIWIQPTVSSILGYGEFELVGGVGAIARNVGAFALLAVVAVLRDGRRWATATPPAD